MYGQNNQRLISVYRNKIHKIKKLKIKLWIEKRLYLSKMPIQTIFLNSSKIIFLITLKYTKNSWLILQKAFNIDKTG